jgi:hypothetical protein
MSTRNKAARDVVRKQLSAEEQARRYEQNAQVRKAVAAHRDRIKQQSEGVSK